MARLENFRDRFELLGTCDCVSREALPRLSSFRESFRRSPETEVRSSLCYRGAFTHLLPSLLPHSLCSAPLHSTPLHSTPLHSTPLHSTPLHSTALIHSFACSSSGPSDRGPIRTTWPCPSSLTRKLLDLLRPQASRLLEAALLADVIINGSVEELALAKLQRKVEEEVLKVQVQARSAGREISTEEASTRACENLRAGGMRSVQMETDGHMKHANRACWGLDAEKRSLAHVKEALGREALGREVSPHKGYAMGRKLGLSGTATTAPAPRGWGRGPAMAMCPSAMPAFSAPAAAPASTSNVLKEDLISSAQVSRMVQKAKCQSRLA